MGSNPKQYGIPVDGWMIEHGHRWTDDTPSVQVYVTVNADADPLSDVHAFTDVHTFTDPDLLERLADAMGRAAVALRARQGPMSESSRG